MSVKTNAIVIRDDVSGYKTTQTVPTLTADRAIKLPNVSGTLADQQSVIDSSVGKPSYRYDGVAGTHISCGNNTQFTFGGLSSGVYYDTAFSSITVAKLDTNNTGNVVFFGRYYNISTEYYFQYLNTGNVRFTLADAGASGVGPKVACPFTLDGKFHAFSTIYDGRGGATAASGMSIWIDGLNQSLTLTQEPTYVSMRAGTHELCIGSESTSGYNAVPVGQFSRFALFNYALTEDKIRRYSAGAKIDWEDVGGSMTAINSVAADQDFSSDTGYWLKSNAGITISAGVAHWASVPTTEALYSNTLALIGKRYRITFTVSAYSAGSVGIYTGHGTVTSTRFNNTVITTTQYATSNGIWEFEVTCIATAMIRLVNIGVTTLSIDNLKFIQLGAVVDLEPENIGASTWLDTSGNSLNGTVTSALPVNVSPLGAMTGTLRSGTGGRTYSTSTTTAITAAAQNLVSLTLNSGKYIVSGAISFSLNIASTICDGGLKIGGTSVTQAFLFNSAVSGGYSWFSWSIPVEITTDATVVAASLRCTGIGAGVVTGPTNEMWAIRIGN